MYFLSGFLAINMGFFLKATKISKDKYLNSTEKNPSIMALTAQPTARTLDLIGITKM